MVFHQAKWDEPLLFDLIDIVDDIDENILTEASKYLPNDIIRKKLSLPNLPEHLVIRHFSRLSQMNYGVDLGIYPLGSCTMKYNYRINEDISSLNYLTDVHPLQEDESVQGILKILYELGLMLSKITGMDYFTLQPAAGAHGEFVGTLIIKKYHESKGLYDKDEIIIPDSAHGTNPASARMAGFKVIEVPSSEDGQVNISALKEAISDKTAGLMITNPNTLGIFESKIKEISELIHGVGGLLYYDGANLNAIAGIVRPGDMGFDIVHLNLHKTFGTPHGGGGPGSGPVGVKAFLRDFLPVPIIDYDGEKYYLNYNLRHTIGKVHSYYGNIGVLVKAYVYIKRLGGIGIRKSSIHAVLASNYLFDKIRRLNGVKVTHGSELPRMHEFVVSLSDLKRDTGVTAKDFSKRLLDYGVHAPTIYFPLIVDEALMVEPTESNTLGELDNYCEVFKKVIEESIKDPDTVKNSPYNTSVRRIDEVSASKPKTMIPTYKWLKEKFK